MTSDNENSLNNTIDPTEDGNDLFYFESEHLALRGNKDYNEILKIITILEAQRAVAIKDIDTIIKIQKSALEDPVSFIEKIKHGDDLGIPCPQKIVELPIINWSKYDIPISQEALKMINPEKGAEDKIQVKKPKKPKFENKYNTYNKPWSSEEQKRLEELLIQFPPEAIEMRRYKKIAEALGNRTVKQVTSRVQKYFLKLYKAGLPIPGRIPKFTDKKKSYIHKHQRHNAYLFKPSTFFPDLHVPVFMTDNDDDEVISGSTQQLPKMDQTINEDVNKDELQVKINLLKKIKIEKQCENKEPGFLHIGYTCDNCNEKPIVGTRWHCYDCTQDSIDFCTNCLITLIKNPNIGGHPITHNIQSIRMTETGQEQDKSSSEMETSDSSDNDSEVSEVSSQNKNQFIHYDKDYVSESVKSYNYLDPNFLPE